MLYLYHVLLLVPVPHSIYQNFGYALFVAAVTGRCLNPLAVAWRLQRKGFPVGFSTVALWSHV